MVVIEYFKNIRLSHWWWWIGVCAIAAYAFNQEVTLKPFLSVVSGFSFLFASVYVLNNTFDHRSDKWNPSKSNPVAKEKVSFKASMVESIILGILGLILLGLVSLEGLLGGGALTMLSIIYHVPPVRTKSRPYLDIITITLLYSTPFFIGYVSINSFDLRGISLALLFGLLSGMVHPFQTAKDLEQDRRNGDKTVSTLIGIKKSMVLSLILVISTMIYFEFLILARVLDPKMFLYPITFIPSMIYYLQTIANPSDKKIDNTVLLLRLNGIFGGALPIYLLVR
jgi:4-hydroxybenzoate polyprenyltransferase